MASLWTRIDYGATRSFPCELRSSEVVALYLRRSKNQPLDIYLSSKYYASSYNTSDEMEYPEIDFQDVQCAIDLIFSSVSRWRSLYIHAFGLLDFYEAQMSLGELAAPLLKYLWIDGGGVPRGDNGIHNILRSGTPALEFVKLEGGAISCCCPPLASVRTLKLWVWEEDDSINSGTFRSMLKSAVSLTTLHVHIGTVHSSHNNVPAFEIPTLRYLEIEGSLQRTPVQTDHIWNLILAPGLEDLKFYFMSSSSVDNIPSFLVSSSGSPKFPALRTLQFEDTFTVDPINEDLIQSLPGVTRLSLINTPTANTLRFLSTTSLWPSLDTFQLQLDSVTPQFDEMLRYRIQIKHPMAKLRFVMSKSCVVPEIHVPNLQVELLDFRTYQMGGAFPDF